MKKLIIVSILLSGALTVWAQDIRMVKITDVENIIAASRKPLIVNMWATWCKPCVEEIPYFIEEVRKRNEKGDSIDLLLVSLDFKEAFPSQIKTFTEKRKFTAPVVWLDETNADYFCPKIDLKWSGAIPASLFVNNKTGYRHFIEEQIKHDDLKEEISRVISK